MTRINLLPASKLTDQHLLAEYRELPRIFGVVLKASEGGKKAADFKIPKTYVLGTGHVKFFYDKILFLEKRQRTLIDECNKRGFKTTFKTTTNIDSIHQSFKNDYRPVQDEINISHSRLQEKIQMKPNWYKYYGKQYNNSNSNSNNGTIVNSNVVTETIEKEEEETITIVKEKEVIQQIKDNNNSSTITSTSTSSSRRNKRFEKYNKIIKEQLLK
eukprot:gene3962-4956_t